MTLIKLQISVPEAHAAVIKRLAELRGASVSSVAQDYLGRALSEPASREYELLTQWSLPG